MHTTTIWLFYVRGCELFKQIYLNTDAPTTLYISANRPQAVPWSSGAANAEIKETRTQFQAHDKCAHIRVFRLCVCVYVVNEAATNDFAIVNDFIRNKSRFNESSYQHFLYIAC